MRNSVVTCLLAGLLVGACSPEKEASYVPPNTKQVQEPITHLGSEAVEKRLEAAGAYLLQYVREVGKFPNARTGFELREVLRAHFAERLAQIDRKDDALTQFEFAWARHDGKGPILYNYGLAGKSLEEVRDPESTWMLRDPIQVMAGGYAEVMANGKPRVAIVSDEPALGGMGNIGSG